MSYSDAEIATIMQELGCSDLQYSSGVIKAKCPCPRSKDRCFVVMPGDSVGYHCHRCKDGGFLSNRVWEEWFNGGMPRTAMQIVVAHDQSRVCGEKPKPKLSSMTYVPLADKPSVVWPEREKDARSSVYGKQLELSGKVEKPVVRKISEADYNRFRSGPSRMLRDRGFSDETQKTYGVRLNVWSKRVVFPVRDWDGELVGMSQRRAYDGPDCPRCGKDIGSGKEMKYKCECGALHAKYLHSKGFKKSTVLYGEWVTQPDCVPVLVEGMTDVLNLYEKGLRPPIAVPLAVMGGSVSKNQIERVLEAFPGKPVWVIRDHDDPAKYTDLPDGVAPGDLMADGVEATIKLLSPETEVVHVIPRMGDDPGDLTEEDVQEVVESICMERGGKVLL